MSISYKQSKFTWQSNILWQRQTTSIYLSYISVVLIVPILEAQFCDSTDIYSTIGETQKLPFISPKHIFLKYLYVVVVYLFID
jgi:hypothetical protein